MSIGYGNVIVILGDQGNILGSYQRSDFLLESEIRMAKRSVSSLWWSKHAWFSFIDDDQRFALVTEVGTVRCFDLASGELMDLNEAQRATIVGMVREQAEAWVESGDGMKKIRGITLLGGMRVSEAIPIAQRLLHDKTITGWVAARRGRPGAAIHGVQEAAANSLTRMIGVDAAPIIEKELPSANDYMKSQLTKILARIDQ